MCNAMRPLSYRELLINDDERDLIAECLLPEKNFFSFEISLSLTHSRTILNAHGCCGGAFDNLKIASDWQLNKAEVLAANAILCRCQIHRPLLCRSPCAGSKVEAQEE